MPEAYYSQIPLIIASADRPSYKIDIGDGQTIQQNGVFNKLVAFCEALEQDVCHATNEIELFGPHLLTKSQDEIESFNIRAIQKAMAVSYSKQLPVHLNFPFEESLYGIGENPPCAIFLNLKFLLRMITSYLRFLQKLENSWKSYKKK